MSLTGNYEIRNGDEVWVEVYVDYAERDKLPREIYLKPIKAYEPTPISSRLAEPAEIIELMKSHHPEIGRAKSIVIDLEKRLDQLSRCHTALILKNRG